MASVGTSDPPSTNNAETNSARLNSQRAFKGAIFWSLVLICAFGILLWIIINPAQSKFETLDNKRAEDRYKTLAEYNEANRKVLNDPPSWVDPEKKFIRLPIAQAMDIAIKELQSIKPHPAEPIATPAPAASPGAPAASPGASAAASPGQSPAPSAAPPSNSPATTEGAPKH